MSINNIKFLTIGLVGAASLSITIILTAIPFTQSGGDLRDAELSYAATTKQMTSALGNLGILQMAARENFNRGDSRLFHCLESEGKCSGVTAKNYFKFRQGIDPALPLAGGDLTEPARIPWNSKCKESDCPSWEVRTWFKAQCPNGATVCDKAESIEVGVNIDMANSKLEFPAQFDLKSDISIVVNIQ